MGFHPQLDGISVTENQYLNAALVSFENVRKCCWQYHETALKIRRGKMQRSERKVFAFVIGSKLHLDHS